MVPSRFGPAVLSELRANDRSCVSEDQRGGVLQQSKLFMAGASPALKDLDTALCESEGNDIMLAHTCARAFAAGPHHCHRSHLDLLGESHPMAQRLCPRYACAWRAQLENGHV
jgi:hypothetical protein